MREWHLTSADPMAPRISADARAGRTHYEDDQTWQLRLGGPDEPALALETRYGGRVGLARLVPVWTLGRRQVYEAQGYHRPPVLVAFTPDLLRVRADLTITLRLALDFWTMESQAVGGRITVENTAPQAQTLRLDLKPQVMRENKVAQLFFLTLADDQPALQVGRFPGLEPVLLLEGADNTAPGEALGRALALEPGARISVKWVLAGLPQRDDSLLLAHRWLNDPGWDAGIAASDARAEAVPQVETGDARWDAALAWSAQQGLRAFLGPTGSLPHPSFVLSRRTDDGFAPRGGHASGFSANWGGQTLPAALHLAPLVALAAPELAQGMVRNFLAVQREDGWIDAKPGLGGQRSGVLAPPLLAALTETVYSGTGDKAFLGECLPGLIAFFNRWFHADMDRDGDGLPEWSQRGQGAFADSPTFARYRRGSQDVEISTVEAPDLVAYLLHEADALIRCAGVLGRADVAAGVTPRRDALRAALDELWDAGRGVFHYRDRETHAWPAGETLYEGKGDQSLRGPLALPAPARLIVRVSGGVDHRPRLTGVIEGLDAAGKRTSETLPGDAFDWYRGAGAATTKTVWREISYLKFDGLSRVYSVLVGTPDLSRHDQSLLLPLWTGDLDAEQAARTLALLTDPAQYWRPYGVPGCPAGDPAYDPGLPNGCGAVSPRWNALFGGALLDQGRAPDAAVLFRRVLAAQVQSLTRDRVFRALYHPATGAGLGDADVIGGLVSWGWFARLFGAFVLAPDQVVISGPFAFEDAAMTWTQHGVRIERSAQGTAIHFPSGRTSRLKPDAEPRTVRDKAPKPHPPPDSAPPAAKPGP